MKASVSRLQLRRICRPTRALRSAWSGSRGAPPFERCALSTVSASLARPRAARVSTSLKALPGPTAAAGHREIVTLSNI